MDQSSIDILDWFSTFHGCRWDAIKKKLPWNEDVPLSRTKAILKSKDKDAIQDLPLMLKCCISELHRIHMKEIPDAYFYIKAANLLRDLGDDESELLICSFYTDLMFDLFQYNWKDFYPFSPGCTQLETRLEKISQRLKRKYQNEFKNEKTKKNYAIAERAVLLLYESFGGHQGLELDDIRSILIDPQRKEYHEECDLYLFETVIPGVYKFGISADYIGRAMKCNKHEKPRYNKFIWNYRCKTRREAFCIETAIKGLHGNSKSFKYSYPKLDPSQTKKLFPKAGSTEITGMEPSEFKELVDSLHVDWETMGINKFIETYCSWKAGFHVENIEGLVDGACAVRRQTHDGQEVLKILMQDEHDLARRWDEYCVQLKDIPCEFERIYGHDFFPPTNES